MLLPSVISILFLVLFPILIVNSHQYIQDSNFSPIKKKNSNFSLRKPLNINLYSRTLHDLIKKSNFVLNF